MEDSQVQSKIEPLLNKGEQNQLYKMYQREISVMSFQTYVVCRGSCLGSRFEKARKPLLRSDV